MLVIPAIDILGGRVVRLHKGDFLTSRAYNESVLEQAELFSESGFKRIHIVDLNGSKEGRIGTKGMLAQIKNKIGIQIQFGGGIRTCDDIYELLDIGIDSIIIGSLPFVNKIGFESVLNKNINSRIIISADVIDEYIHIKGWSENSRINIEEHINYCMKFGLTDFLITDIDKDGSLTGSNIKLYEKILALFPGINLIASGGIVSIDELTELKHAGCTAAIIGRSIYEGKIKLEEAVKFGC